MPDFPVRKIAVLFEEIRHDGGPAAEPPKRRAAALAVVKNPFAGGYTAELQSAMDDLKPLGLDLTERLIAALGDPKAIDVVAWQGREAEGILVVPRAGEMLYRVRKR